MNKAVFQRKAGLAFGAIIIFLLVTSLFLNTSQAQAAVIFTQFVATPGDTQISVRWTTASEINTNGFYVIASASETGVYSRVSAFIPRQGTGISGASYEFVHTGLTNGIPVYYKLEIINSDLTSIYTGVDLGHSKYCHTYPNNDIHPVPDNDLYSHNDPNSNYNTYFFGYTNTQCISYYNGYPHPDPYDNHHSNQNIYAGTNCDTTTSHCCSNNNPGADYVSHSLTNSQQFPGLWVRNLHPLLGDIRTGQKFHKLIFLEHHPPQPKKVEVAIILEGNHRVQTQQEQGFQRMVLQTQDGEFVTQGTPVPFQTATKAIDLKPGVSSSSIGWIIGILVGLSIIGGAVWYYFRKYRNNEESGDNLFTDDPDN